MRERESRGKMGKWEKGGKRSNKEGKRIRGLGGGE